MCIGHVSTVKPKSKGWGYKVFRIEKDGIHSAFTRVLNPWRTWITAIDSGGNEPGFHIYATRRSAEKCLVWYEERQWDLAPQQRVNFRIFKVHYRKATKQGTGDGGFTSNSRVILAQEIFIP